MADLQQFETDQGAGAFFWRIHGVLFMVRQAFGGMLFPGSGRPLPQPVSSPMSQFATTPGGAATHRPLFAQTATAG